MLTRLSHATLTTIVIHHDYMTLTSAFDCSLEYPALRSFSIPYHVAYVRPASRDIVLFYKRHAKQVTFSSTALFCRTAQYTPLRGLTMKLVVVSTNDHYYTGEEDEVDELQISELSTSTGAFDEILRSGGRRFASCSVTYLDLHHYY